METEIGSPQDSRSLNPADGGEAAVFVGELGALFAALIESSTGARRLPNGACECTECHSGDVVVCIGENATLTEAGLVQPATWNLHGAEIIVVRSTPQGAACAATQHYLIRPGTDLALLYGLANILIASGWIDRDDIGARNTGFEEFAQFVTQFTTDIVSNATGLSADDLWHIAQTISDGKRVSFRWTPQRGTNPTAMTV